MYIKRVMRLRRLRTVCCKNPEVRRAERASGRIHTLPEPHVYPIQPVDRPGTSNYLQPGSMYTNKRDALSQSLTPRDGFKSHIFINRNANSFYVMRLYIVSLP